MLHCSYIGIVPIPMIAIMLHPSSHRGTFTVVIIVIYHPLVPTQKYCVIASEHTYIRIKKLSKLYVCINVGHYQIKRDHTIRSFKTFDNVEIIQDANRVCERTCKKRRDLCGIVIYFWCDLIKVKHVLAYRDFDSNGLLASHDNVAYRWHAMATDVSICERRRTNVC